MKQTTHSPENSAPVDNSEDLIEQLSYSMGAIQQWLKAHVPDPDSRADILQETLLAALQGISQFQEGAAFSTWLIAIARNKSLKHFEGERRKGRTRNGRERFNEHLHSDIRAGAGAGAYSPFDVGIDLERLLSVLTVEQCEDIRLHYIEGYSMEELAGLHGCTRTAMMVRVKRAMDKVRRHIY